MPRTQSQNPDLDELPGFDPVDPPEPAEVDDELLENLEESQPASPAPATTSTSPSPPASAPELPSPPSRPTETSSERADPDPELTDGLEFLAGGLFELLGQFLNRMVRVRRRQQTTLWLVTDEEADAFAAPMARIAERRLPDELKQGDAKDLLIAGSVAVEYATHNAAGEPGVEPRPVQGPIDQEAPRGRLQDPGPPQQAAPPPPAPTAPQGAPTPEPDPLVPPEL